MLNCVNQQVNNFVCLLFSVAYRKFAKVFLFEQWLAAVGHEAVKLQLVKPTQFAERNFKTQQSWVK